MTEKVARNQIGIFTLIAMGVACVGVLGLMSNKVVERTKEIDIRKVLGAELFQIIQILLNTNTKQIIIVTVISFPVVYILVSRYLEKFTESKLCLKFSDPAIRMTIHRLSPQRLDVTPDEGKEKKLKRLQ